MNLQIRDANETDIPMILAIYNDAVINTTAVYDYAPRSIEAQQVWFRDKQTSHYPVLVAENEQGVVGYCSYGTFRAWPAYSRTVEWSVYIGPNFRGLGIASKLLPALIERARNQGLHSIIAGIDATNEVSLGLHKKFGFVEVGRLQEVGWKFDRWLDLVFMQLILSQ